MDPAQFREEFWRDVKEKFISDNINMGIKRKKVIAKIVKNNNIDSVLELGCCSGGNLKRIRERCPGIKLVGLDINDRALRYAKEVEQIDAEFICGSLYDLSQFPDKSFDLVFTCAVLVHLPSEKVKGIISEMKRISRRFIFNIEYNGPNLVLTESEPGKPYIWQTDYVGTYKELGLSGVKIRKMEDVVPKTKIGVARHIIWSSLNGEVLKVI